MNIITLAQTRYSTKEFIKDKLISEQNLEQIKALLSLCPSSTNIQPWHFILASSDEAKQRIAKSTEGFYAFNKSKVLDSSLVVVFCSRVDADQDYLRHLTAKEQRDGRFANEEFKQANHEGRLAFAAMHKFQHRDLSQWLEKQVYLNLGFFLLGVAALGLDAVPMEGCDCQVLNDEFELVNRGFSASFIVAVGYRATTDFNAELAKSRLNLSELIDQL